MNDPVKVGDLVTWSKVNSEPVAIMVDGVFKGAIDSGHVFVDGATYNVQKLPENAKELGLYKFIHIPMNVPEGQKSQGTTITIDHESGTVTETWNYLDLTQEDIDKAAQYNKRRFIERIKAVLALPIPKECEAVQSEIAASLEKLK